MPRTYGPKQRLIWVPVYPKSQAEQDLERVVGLNPEAPTARITRRALEIGLRRLATQEDDLVPYVYGARRRLFRVPIYPKSQAESDLRSVRDMHPAVPTARITRRALEIGLGRLAALVDELVPGEGEAA